jgi:DNA-binding CsgD family transcriptional regulator
MSNKEIAYELGITPTTVAMHLASARAKLAKHLRTALWFFRHGSEIRS